MQAAPRRVRTIYSVIASPQRLEILKILNVKGPLTYSALKSLAGFKSKKESGKFAYHLRKLVRQLLIQLNRQERKYTVTNLGRLVLNLTRQIEEQSLIESGKLYVRTTRQAMEEFNADKILQSLVKEAGMPVELAQKITSETESRLYKFQTQYLTAPLIREMVNSLLVEQNLEEYRHKLTRLGLPVFDVTQLLAKAGGDGGDVGVAAPPDGQVRLLRVPPPRAAPQGRLRRPPQRGHPHLGGGDVGAHSPTRYSSTSSPSARRGSTRRGGSPDVPMLPSPGNLEEAINVIANITPLIKKEANQEIVYRNFLQYLAQFTRSRTKHDVADALVKFFDQVSSVLQPTQRPSVTLQLDLYVKDDAGRELMEKTLDATLDAYRDYVEQVPRPEVRLLLAKPHKSEDDIGYLKDAAAIIFHGGKVAFFPSGQKRSSLGINLDILPPDHQGDNVSVLHNLSINLPRLSYESNQDETYFRAKLSMLMGVASDALITQKAPPGEGDEQGAAARAQLRLGQRELRRDAAGDEPGRARRGPLRPEQGRSARRQGGPRREDPRDRRAVRRREVGEERAPGDRAHRGGGGGAGWPPSTRRGTAGRTSRAWRSGDTRRRQADAGGPQQRRDDGLRQEAQPGRRRQGSRSTWTRRRSTSAGSTTSRSSALAKLEFFGIERIVSFCRNCGSKLPAKTERCKKCRSTATAQYSTAE